MNDKIAFQPGIETLLQNRQKYGLNGRKIGLLSHQAALDSKGASTAQRLYRELGANLVALFGPEHGFAGQAKAGEDTFTVRHRAWNIPVFSLYGEHRAPSPAMFEGIELIVCDLQDLGARCYTYLATLKNMLVACAERNLPVIVADRPIPLPATIDGPMLQPELESFVAPHNLPLCTGMTPGETAQWLQHDMQLDLDLQIAPMLGWKRDGRRGADWPDFIPPSPGIRTWESGQTYLTTVFTEALPDIDVGRGTGMAFRLIGAPWLQSSAFCQQMGNFQLPGIAFYPYRYIAGTPPHAGQELDGIRLSVTDTGKCMPVTCAVHILNVLQQLRGKEKLWEAPGSRPEWFDKLYGTTATREALQQGVSPQEITAAWSMEQQEYNHSRQKFLLY